VEGDVLAVLLAHGVRGAHAVAAELPELGDGGVDIRRLCRGRNGHDGTPDFRRWYAQMPALPTCQELFQVALEPLDGAPLGVDGGRPVIGNDRAVGGAVGGGFRPAVEIMLRIRV